MTGVQVSFVPLTLLETHDLFAGQGQTTFDQVEIGVGVVDGALLRSNVMFARSQESDVIRFDIRLRVIIEEDEGVFDLGITEVLRRRMNHLFDGPVLELLGIRDVDREKDQDESDEFQVFHGARGFSVFLLHVYCIMYKIFCQYLKQAKNPTLACGVFYLNVR